MVESAKKYDLFVSYADGDRTWVEGYLLDSLKQAEINYLSEAAFTLGAPRLREFERAIQQSHRTLLVLSKAYAVDSSNDLVSFLAQSYCNNIQTWPVIPLIYEPVELPLGLQMLVPLDVTDPSEWEAAVARLCNDLKQTIPAPLPRLECPYPGMIPFSEATSDRFFGRDQEIDELIERLRLYPLMTVIGPSGSGKSSLVFAGLIPKLRRSGLFGVGEWLVLTMRPGETPQTTLKGLLNSDLSVIPHTVTKLLANQPNTQQLLLVVDQFEELFTLSANEASCFQDILLRLAGTPNCYVVLTVRADFYPELMVSPLWQAIELQRMEVVPLDEERLRQAILKPAEDIGVFIEPGLLEKLVDDASGEPGVLPLIQETLVLLWERIERRFLPRQAYDGLSSEHHTGLQVAIARRADASLATLTINREKQQAIARRVFLRLVQFGEGRADTRRQQPLEALQAVGDDPGLFSNNLDCLVKNRLLTLSGDENNKSCKKVDIAHEALIAAWPTLRQWIAQRREVEQTRRRLTASVEEWVRLGKEVGGLLDKIELAEAQRWLDSPDAIDLGYDQSLPTFVKASRDAIEVAEQRELQLIRERLEQEKKAGKIARRLNWIAGISSLLLVGLTTYSFIQQNRASQSERNAQQLSVVSDSRTSEALLASNQQLESLLSALRLGKRIREAKGNWADAETTMVATIALQQVVYGIREQKRLEATNTSNIPSGLGLSVSVSPDGKTIASIGDDETIKLWSLDGTLLKTLKGHQEEVQDVQFSPNGKFLASASSDKSIKLWDLEGKNWTLKGKNIKTFQDSAEVFGISFSSDSQMLATGSFDGTVKLLQIATGRVQTLGRHAKQVGEVSFDPLGQLIASASHDGIVKLWRRDGKSVTTLPADSGKVAGVIFSPNGQFIASAYERNTIHLWNRNGTRIRSLTGHLGSVENVQFSSDSKNLASVGQDGTVQIYQLNDQSPTIMLRGHRGLVTSVKFIPNSLLLVSGGIDHTLRIWKPSGIVPTTLQHDRGKVVYSVRFNREGTLIASAGEDKVIKLWYRDGRLFQRLVGHTKTIVNLNFSPDGKTIASTSADGTVKLWSLNGKILHTLQGHQGTIFSTSFSSDGRTIASAGADKTVRLWNLNGKLLHILQGHQEVVNSVDFNPENNLLASASTDKTVKLWSLDGKLQQTLTIPEDSVSEVRWSPDGKTLVAAAGNNVWLRRQVGERYELFGQPLAGHGGAILGMSFNPDGTILAVAGYDREIKLWSFPDRRLLQVIRGHKNNLYDISFSPDGKTIATTSENTVTLRSIDLNTLMALGCGWIQNYLTTNPNLSENDRHLCDGVKLDNRF